LTIYCDTSFLLSSYLTETSGYRALDILHVGSALEIRSRKFFSFDLRQQQLAKAAGLDIAF
jgi:hypothetical protein